MEPYLHSVKQPNENIVWEALTPCPKYIYRISIQQRRNSSRARTCSDVYGNKRFDHNLHLNTRPIAAGRTQSGTYLELRTTERQLFDLPQQKEVKMQEHTTKIDENRNVRTNVTGYSYGTAPSRDQNSKQSIYRPSRVFVLPTLYASAKSHGYTKRRYLPHPHMQKNVTDLSTSIRHVSRIRITLRNHIPILSYYASTSSVRHFLQHPCPKHTSHSPAKSGRDCVLHCASERSYDDTGLDYHSQYQPKVDGHEDSLEDLLAARAFV